MNLNLKKKLAVKTLGVGKSRIMFNESRLDEIKEAITRQDIRDLVKSKAIIIKEIKGRRKKIKRKTRVREGKRKIKVNISKQKYVKLTRKLRRYVKEMKLQGKIDKEKYKELRRQIKIKMFKSKRNLKEHSGI